MTKHASILLMFFWSLPAVAQDDDLEVEFFFDEAETVVSAARHEQDIGMSPSAIWVLTREDIEASGATSIPDLLRLVPGMDVIMLSPYYISTSARLYRSAENQHFLVLIDGREANLELLGQPPWEIQPISLEDVERIEIIRGPGSSLYGANAMAGVISITTRAVSKQTSGWARIASGEAGQLASGARVTTGIGNWGLSVSGGFQKTGFFTDPGADGGDVWKLRAVANYQWAENRRLLLDAGLASGGVPMAAISGPIRGDLSITTLRASYESEALRGQLYWFYAPAEVSLETPLEYSGILLARFRPINVDTHTVDGEVQWTLPRFWSPLLLIAGGGARFSWLQSDDLLDGETYADLTSPRYHQEGIDHWEARTGAFIHGEIEPADFVTCTFGLRFDYNTVTGAFLSPRVAAVFRPVQGHFLRLGAARAFRKPAFLETHSHPIVDFPDTSPITGPAQGNFLEFMAGVIGNPELHNEELLSIEAGYLGRFLDGRLSITMDFYLNLNTEIVVLKSEIVPDTQGLPDLGNSTLLSINSDHGLRIFGTEMSVRFNPNRNVSLLFSWIHREVFDLESEKTSDATPKNLLTLGGRFRTDWGLVGSLYAFSRSEYWNRSVGNPAGLFMESLHIKLPNAFLVLGRLGWKFTPAEGIELEGGLKLFLPVSPFSAPHFRYFEEAGGVTINGQQYGGMELARMVTGYLQGSF
ncbi:TonB-dependent receptor plug domain-containing protein [Myxococcota bacterium]